MISYLVIPIRLDFWEIAFLAISENLVNLNMIIKLHTNVERIFK